MYQYPQQPPAYYPQQQQSGCVKAILYIISFLAPFPVGVIIAVIFMSRPDPESKSIGNTCLIVSIISMALSCCLSVIAGVLMGLGILPMFALPFLAIPSSGT